jgi:putative nucleotidyltransferase with HDIG domain
MTETPVARLLVVDDEESIREVLVDFLTMEGYHVVAVSRGKDAIVQLERNAYDVVLLDLKMPEMDGLELLEHVQRIAPRAFSIMMTGFGTVQTAIAAMKRGAFDYILKPFKVQDVIRLVERGLAQQSLQAENIQLREALKLYDVNEAMTATLQPEKIYDLLIDTAREEIGADAIALWTRQGSELCLDRRWMRSDLESIHAQIVSRVDIPAILAELERGRGIFQNGDAQKLTGAAGQHLVTLMAVPLRSKNETMGVFVGFAFEQNRLFTEGKRKMLAVLCGRASAAIENAQLYGNLKTTFKQTIQAFANLLEDKDPYTRGHSDRVSKYARMIAEGLELPSEEVELIADAALMHDIGKLGIRYEDLNKAEPLTEGEYEMFKSHTTRGRWILEPIEFLHNLIPGVYTHHERWDGRGYPLGLAGENIPLHGRILAIADTYDAMTSHRAYRRALPHDVAIREIQNFAGRQFDPELVKIFVREIAQDRSVRKAKAARWEALRQTSRPRQDQGVEGMSIGFDRALPAPEEHT